MTVTPIIKPLRIVVLTILLLSNFAITANSSRFQLIKVGEINSNGSIDIKNILDRKEIVSTLATDNDNSKKISTDCEMLKKMPFSRGQNGTLVEELQKCMQKDGLYNWPNGFTGYFGPYTEDTFKKWANYSVREIKAPEAVATIAKAETSTKVETTDCQKLKASSWNYGETSESVKKLQICMIDAGVFKHEHGATGYFGNVTKKALENWKK